jgi:hypothetical protein
MGDSMTTGVFKSHIVLACITCEKVILFTETHKDWREARKATQRVMQLISAKLGIANDIFNLFLPTTCSSCSRVASWKSLSISRNMMELWQPYLAMKAFLEGDLSLVGLPMSLVHCKDVKETAGSNCVIRSVEVNPSSGAAAQAHPYLQGGFI